MNETNTQNKNNMIEKGTTVCLPSAKAFVHSSDGSMNIFQDIKLTLDADATILEAWNQLIEKYQNTIEDLGGIPKKFFFKSIEKSKNCISFVFGLGEDN